MCSPIIPNEWRRPDITDRFPGCLPERVPQPRQHEIPGCLPEQLPQPPKDEIHICFPPRTPTGTFPSPTDCWPDVVLENPFEDKIAQNREEWASTVSMPGPDHHYTRIQQEPRTCFGSAGLDIVA